MYYKFIAAFVLLIILSSIQYTLNKIVILLKEIKNILYRLDKLNLDKDDK
ncbi:hypothetical protein [Maledivibacter halophilus]|uniref:Uncharacterized protein n=1 Tax=Maledivibacter halophilus TaxID=36842 RepID=A0A1T5IVP0_9FIRM|nr:hypothetical protein [Maledivibacter halophilus]SKC43266.1 hypothetical protein SAMN02194393_00800 [Maledivibacter halophilus]